MSDGDKEEKQWVLCPVCGAKTRLQLLRETELKAFPLFCPKCKCESIIDAKNFIIETKKPDAKTQC
jgi:predicted Zn-ribbon and HTH transcriptional regulator